MILRDEKVIWKEMVVAYFNEMWQYFLGGTEENDENPER
jgi:hypothetical protein